MGREKVYRVNAGLIEVSEGVTLMFKPGGIVRLEIERMTDEQSERLSKLTAQLNDLLREAAA